MPTLGILLEEIKIGTEVFKERQTKEEILETFDDDDEIYKTSKLISLLSAKLNEEKIPESEKIIKKLKRIGIKMEATEEKLAAGPISKSYARMKLDSMREDYDSIVSDLQNKKVLRSLDHSVLANALALTMFESTKLKEIAEITSDYRFAECPETLKPFFEKEAKLILETIG